MRLPPFLLDPFLARRIDNPVVVLFSTRSPSLTERYVLDNLSFAGPVSMLNGINNVKYKQFFAERYGGAGIGTNGGGARCGTDGEWIVKGMGSNQLQGAESTFWYGHGSLPLVDAVTEAIWAKILNHALPYGSIEAPAVIATGRQSWTRGRDGSHDAHPGSLLVREATVRLGSFERAVFFKPAKMCGDSSTRTAAKIDVVRTKTAINYLPSYLSINAANSLAVDEPSPDSIVERLCGVFRRIAMQSAAASSKRIMHGALTGSNISIDSRWLDLGCVTGLRDFGIDASFKPSMWREYRAISPSIRNILFYLKKYHLPSNRLDVASASRFVCTEMETAHRNYLEISILERCGFPFDIVQELIGSREMLELARYLLAIVQKGTAVDHTHFSECRSRIGDYDFFRICRILSSMDDEVIKIRQLTEEFGNTLEATEGLKKFDAALSLINLRLGDEASRPRLDRLIHVNCIKSSAIDDLFIRSNLNDYVMNVVRTEGVSTALRSRLEDLNVRMDNFSSLSLRNNVGLTSFCDRFENCDTHYCSISDSFLMRNEFGVTARSWSEMADDDQYLLSDRFRHSIPRKGIRRSY